MSHETDIAIISMACRFPEANSVEQFWENLCADKALISRYTDEELLAAGVPSGQLADPNYVKAGTWLPNIENFDPFFFNIPPHEAETIDPQQRIFLECAWEAIERAGYDPEQYSGLIGVYAGSSQSSYNPALTEAKSADPLAMGTESSFMPTRVSYKLNLKGPSMAVQTACSTSLVAVHLACQSLLSGECDMVLAGGVSISLPQKQGYLYQENMIMSPDGHCRAFDAKAQGTVGGRGAGVVLLKGLAEALADGDMIYAVIKGSAINNDGADKVGYTAPSVTGQMTVIQEAQAIAGVTPESISYVEAHGTGTVLGDPIEFEALTQAFETEAKGYCALGSVKTNMGHTDAAAGVAGLIKTALALYHKQIPASLHFETPNPAIDLANSPFYVNTTLSNWSPTATPRRAGVSSFGIGGTNAHAVLEEAPAPVKPVAEASQRPWQLLLLSAKTRSALETITTNLADHLANQSTLNLAEVAYTLQVGRQRHSQRRMMLCYNNEDARQALLTPARHLTTHQEAKEHPVLFMFPGQGTQFVMMGYGLYETEPTFRETVDDCADLLEPLLGFDLREVLYPPEANRAEATERLNQTALAQPALFVIEYALAQLWLAWGIEPQAMMGHSLGEYVAACLAGVFSLADALKLVVIRGQLMQGQPAGAMLAVSLPQVEIPLKPAISVAAINGPQLSVVSGPIAEIEALAEELLGQGITCRRLKTSHAFHSPMMEPVLAEFRQQVAEVDRHPPQIPYISNVTGRWITGAEIASPDYWVSHLRETVRFGPGLAELLTEPDLILLEVGPCQTLSGLVKKHPAKVESQQILGSMASTKDHEDDEAHLLATLGQLWLAGGTIDWEGYHRHHPRQRVLLPTYPFERQRCWVEGASQQPQAEQPAKPPRQAIEDWFYEPSWKYQSLARQSLSERFGWVLFIDEVGLGENLADALQQANQPVITVKRGAEFAQLSETAFVVNPTSVSDYEMLWQSLPGKPQKIIHLWNVYAEDAFDYAEAETCSFYSLVYLAQALGNQQVTEALDVFIVSNHLHNVTGTDRVEPMKALLLGPTRVWPQEYENISVSNLDVTWPAPETVNHLLTEFAGPITSPIIAYRGPRRWLASVEPIQLPKVSTSTAIKPNGVYLITGGLGLIGLTLAEALAKWQTRLVLLGRSDFPAHDRWTDWVNNHGADDPISQKIKRLQHIERLGAEIITVAADVADRDRIKGVIKEVSDRFGSIQGIIHVAGTFPNRPIYETDQATTAQTLAPKVLGTLALAEAGRDLSLDFIVFCSSLTTTIGGFGHCTYTAACAFQDAFAQNHAFPIPTISIDWDGWEFTDEDRVDFRPKGIHPQEGVQLFFQALSSGLPQPVISVEALNQRIERTRSFTALQSLIETPTTSHNRPELSVAYIAPQTPTEEWLAEIWQSYLKLTPIGRNDDFFNHLGGDSLSAMGLMTSIRQPLGAIVHLQALFESPTIALFADYLDENYGVALAQVGLQETLNNLKNTNTVTTETTERETFLL